MTYITGPGELWWPLPHPWVYPPSHLGTTITIGDHTRTAGEWWDSVAVEHLSVGDVIYLDGGSIGIVLGVEINADDADAECCLLMRVDGEMRVERVSPDPQPGTIWRKVS